MPQEDLQLAIVGALRSMQGLASSPELQARLGVSQPTAHRALAALMGAGEIIEVGAARARRYILPRKVTGVDAIIPITKVDAEGNVSNFGRLIPMHGGRFWLDEVDGPCGGFDGLPWFMSDMRPQGFIGRTFSHAHPELGLVANPEHWSDDDVLKALTVAGEDLPGNLIVGQASFERFHGLRPLARQVASPSQFPEMALEALQGTAGGSSAGGEQPKFCAVREDRHVIVKFAPADLNPVAQRSRDLLVCEHLALATLSAGGCPAAESEVHLEGGQVFLEVLRFDRTTRGRIGMVSLLAYDAEYVGAMSNWAITAGTMEKKRLLRPEDARQLRLLEAFGLLIGNTDRHYGNISLLIDDDDWVLSPTYDMLPMVYAPVGGSLVERDFTPANCHSTLDTLEVWEEARALAGRFWQAVANDERISVGFRSLAAQHADLDWPGNGEDRGQEPGAEQGLAQKG